MKRIDFRRIFFLAGVMALVINYAALWARMIANPVERTGSDFIAFYAAGRVAQADGLTHVYDAALQQSVQEQQVGFPLAPGQVLLYNHVPYLVPFLVGLVNDNYVASFLRWVLLLAGLFAVSTWTLTILLSRAGWSRAEAWRAAAGILTFFPFFISLMNGQDTAFTTLGLCGFLFGLLTGRDWLAGFGLALATVRPHIAAFLAIPFMFQRQKVFAWFCAGSALLGGFSLLLLGWSGMRGFLDLLLVSVGGDFFGMNESAMVNLVGLLTRLVPDLGRQTIHWIGWGAYLAAIGSLCIVWFRNRELDERHYGLAVILSVFLAPHLHFHDLTLLLIPVVCIMLYVVRSGWIGRNTALLLSLEVSWLLVFGNFLPALKSIIPYLLVVLLIMMLWYPKIIFRCYKVTP